MIVVEDVTRYFRIAWKTIAAQAKVIEATWPKTVPAGQGTGWGGWSLTSSTGDHTDGWFEGQKSFEQAADGSVKSKRAVPDGTEFVKYTQIVTPQLRSCVEQARLLGLYPRRARITQLDASKSTDWHVDSLAERKLTRLHFVIETNPQAVFVTEQQEHHLQLHHVYIFGTDGYHLAKNDGPTPRTHLMMDVSDTRGISQHNRYVKV